MAISVKTFLSELNCDEPLNEIQVQYTATSGASGANELCGGGGTLTNIYSDSATLGDIYSGAVSPNGANTDLCADGMDVVFVVDYTGSMSSAISGVKTGITQIANTISTESGGNYRLGLVLYDEYTNGASISYASSGYYQGLPSAQKIVNSGTGHFQVFTCNEKMNTIGNLTTFTNNLNSIDANSNSSTGMVLGNGAGDPEPGGLCTYEVAQNNFAGQWRSDALKLIIHITDIYPGGDDDTYNSTDVNFFQSTLTPALDALNIQFFHNTSQHETSPVEQATYDYLVDNTTPSGLGSYSLTYSNSNWVNAMIQGIEDLCDETTTYSCDAAPAGWYAEPNPGPGDTLYYWDGTAWTTTHVCPEPTYRLTVTLVDNMTNAHINPILASHPYYQSTNSYVISATAGTVVTLEAQADADAGYVDPPNITSVNVSDPAILSTSTNSATGLVTITATMPSSDQSETVQLNGSASQPDHTLYLAIIGFDDTLDVNGATQTPTGVLTLTGNDSNTWQQFVYSGEDSIRTSITGQPGTSFNWEVTFGNTPADYDLAVQETPSSVEYLDSSNNPSTDVQNAMTTGGNTFSIEGQGNTPQRIYGTSEIINGTVRIHLTGQINQPDYRYTLYSYDNISNADVLPADVTQVFSGYTGETFNFSSDCGANNGYTNLEVTGVQPYTGPAACADNNAISNLAIATDQEGSTGTITMPDGGGSGCIIMSGTADAIIYNFQVTIQDSITGTTWNTHTFSGAAGSAQSTITAALTDNDYTYNITSVTDDSPILQSGIQSATTPSINLSLTGGMPVGGGSAIVTIEGSSTPINHTMEVDIVLDSPVTGGSFSPSNSYTFTGATGSTYNGNFNWIGQSGQTYTASDVVSDNSAVTASLTGSEFDTDYTITMPQGGGSATLTVQGATSTATSYTYTLTFSDSQFTGLASALSSSITSGGVFTGTAGTTFNFTISLTTSPNYYDVDVSTISTTGPQASAISNLVWNDSTQEITGTITMPSGGGSGVVQPRGEVSNPTYTYTVYFQEFIGNCTISNGNSVTFTGVTGSTHSHTVNLLSDPGYTHTVSTTTHGGGFGTEGGTSSATAGQNVSVGLTMPQGGGSGTVYIYGSSSQVSYTATMFYREHPYPGAGQSAGGWSGNTVVSYTGVVGSTHNLSNTWIAASGYDIVANTEELRANSQTGTSHNDNGNFSNESFSGGNANYTPYSSTFTMPLNGGTYDIIGYSRFTAEAPPTTTTTTTTTTTAAPCDCNTTTPPLFSVQPATQGLNNGRIDVTLTDYCGGAVASILVSIDGGSFFNANSWWTTNQLTQKSKRSLAPGSYDFIFNWDDGCSAFNSSQTVQLLVTTTTTTTTESGGGPREGFGPEE